MKTEIKIGVFGDRKGDKTKIRLRKLRSLLYADRPVCCACGCEMPRHRRGGLCEDCERESLKLGADICNKCGRMIANEAEYCDTCKSRERAYRRARSCFVYDGKIRKLVHKLKFGGKRYLAAFFAEAIADRYLDCDYDCDCIVAVPLSAKRKLWRGYDQAELIAEELSAQLRLPLISGALVKVKDNKMQARLGLKEREENVRGVYELTDAAPFKGKRVLVIDDVLTTGATLGEVSKVIYKARARSVDCLTYASTRSLAPTENILDEEDYNEDEMV